VTKKTRTALVLVAIGALWASCALAGPASADTIDRGARFTVPDGVILAHASHPRDIPLPDGRALRPSADATVVRTSGETRVAFADGLEVAIPFRGSRATPGGYFDPIVTTYSRSQTETVYKAINNIGNICRFLPLPYLASLGCGASPTLRDAFTKAHYQSKRVQSLFYRSKVYSSCSRTDYRVIS
jgi:hypothetical protein